MISKYGLASIQLKLTEVLLREDEDDLYDLEIQGLPTPRSLLPYPPFEPNFNACKTLRSILHISDRNNDITALREASQPQSKRSVRFSYVEVYEFLRQQGFVSVPNTGGCSLGMGRVHVAMKKYNIEEDDTKSSGDVDASINIDDDSDESFEEGSHTLKRLSPAAREKILKEAGVTVIDKSEAKDLKNLRDARAACGCLCKHFCDPLDCACFLADIPCMVDENLYPCGCIEDTCMNFHGRLEMNKRRIDDHYEEVLRPQTSQKKYKVDNELDKEQTYKSEDSNADALEIALNETVESDHSSVFSADWLHNFQEDFQPNDISSTSSTKPKEVANSNISGTMALPAIEAPTTNEADMHVPSGDWLKIFMESDIEIPSPPERVSLYERCSTLPDNLILKQQHQNPNQQQQPYYRQPRQNYMGQQQNQDQQKQQLILQQQQQKPKEEQRQNPQRRQRRRSNRSAESCMQKKSVFNSVGSGSNASCIPYLPSSRPQPPAAASTSLVTSYGSYSNTTNSPPFTPLSQLPTHDGTTVLAQPPFAPRSPPPFTPLSQPPTHDGFLYNNFIQFPPAIPYYPNQMLVSEQYEQNFQMSYNFDVPSSGIMMQGLYLPVQTPFLPYQFALPMSIPTPQPSGFYSGPPELYLGPPQMQPPQYAFHYPSPPSHYLPTVPVFTTAHRITTSQVIHSNFQIQSATHPPQFFEIEQTFEEEVSMQMMTISSENANALLNQAGAGQSGQNESPNQYFQ